jgi:hypothetical protein
VSYQIGMDAIHLRWADRVAHTEYCSNDALVRTVTGLDPATDPEAIRRFQDAWEFDLLWRVDDGPVPWPERGRTTQMGHAEFLEHGRDRRPAVPCPFESPQEVWAFDAVAEYGLPDFNELVAYYEQSHRQAQAAHPEQVCTGGYYKTLVSGAIAAFGWEMLLTAASDQDRFERVLDSFARLSAHHFRAWAETSAEVLICHDDMVWAEGPFMSPEFHRRAIIPRYARIWQPCKAAGKKLLYCCDGDFSMFLDDIAEAGADGFIFEPLVPLEEVAAKFARTHVIVGSKVDCRTLTFGTKEQIGAEVAATLKVAERCPGFVFAVGNHIPSNVPVENALAYFDYLSRDWARRR